MMKSAIPVQGNALICRLIYIMFQIYIILRRGAIQAISFRSDPISLSNCVINML